MKNKFSFCIISLFLVIIFSNCATKRQNDFSKYDFSLKDTLAVFLLNNEEDYYFCIPVQYSGDYKIGSFKFINGNILIGNYNILLKRNRVDISVYLNETANDDGNAVDNFNLIYLQKSGKVLVSKMAEPLAVKNESDNTINHYYIFIEKHLTYNEMKKIVSEYEKGNVYSQFSVWYDITIDNNEQNGSGLLDNFELYDGLAIDPVWFPTNLNFFKAKYLQK